MTVFRIDGFETYGDNTATDAQIETRIGATMQTTHNLVSGGLSGSKSLVFADTGLALQYPTLGSAQGDFITYEFPDGSYRHKNLKVSTNSSIDEIVCGFRVYVPDITDNLDVTLFQNLTGVTTVATTVSILGGTGMRVRDASSTNHDVTGVLTKGQWHYIEIEYKMAPSSAGGFMKVYVDGTEQISTGSVNICSFTFFSQYGCRLGVQATSNQLDTSENFRLDDVYLLYEDGVINTGPIGECKVVPLEPDADATPNDWTPSTGSDNWDMVNGQGWDTATYVEGSSGNDDHYTTEDLSGADTVHAVQFTTILESVTSASDLHLGCDNGTADEQDMGSIATGTGGVSMHQCHETDPSGSAWTQSSVNSVESTQRVV